MPVETLNALSSSVRVPRPLPRAGGRDGCEGKGVRIGIEESNFKGQAREE